MLAFHLLCRNVGARWAKPLPPPREVIDHDNAVKKIPHMTNFESVDQTPVEQVIFIVFICGNRLVLIFCTADSCSWL